MKEGISISIWSRVLIFLVREKNIENKKYFKYAQL